MQAISLNNKHDFFLLINLRTCRPAPHDCVYSREVGDVPIYSLVNYFRHFSSNNTPLFYSQRIASTYAMNKKKLEHKLWLQRPGIDRNRTRRVDQDVRRMTKRTRREREEEERASKDDLQ